MDFKEADTIIFDFDGTLARAEIDFALMKSRLLNLAGEFGVDEGQLQESYALELLEEVNAVIEGRGTDQAHRFNNRACSIIEDMELDAARRGEILEGIEPAMNILKDMGYKLGIVTRNCTRAVEIILTTGAIPYDLLLTRDHVPAPKPHPVHLNTAIRKLGSDASRAIMVGDSSIDMVAGIEAGIRLNVGVLTGRYSDHQLMEAGACCILESAAHLPGFLNQNRSSV